MKKFVKSASEFHSAKVVYAPGLDVQEPELKSFTVEGAGDFRDFMIDLIEHYLNLPYLELPFDDDELDEDTSAEDIIEAIQYHNGEEVDKDYLFLLQIDGKEYINNIHPEEHF